MQNYIFNQRLGDLKTKFMSFNTKPMEAVNDWCGQKVPHVFAYAATSEKNMELNMKNIGKKRETTYMFDLAIAEWVEGRNGVLETIIDALKEHATDGDTTYTQELTISIYFKGMEHYSRGKIEWAKFYFALFKDVRYLMYDYYDNDNERSYTYWKYLD